VESAARLVCLKTQQSCVTMLRPGTATCCVQSVHLLRKKVWTNSWLFVQQAMSIMCPANTCCCRNTGCHVDACDRCCTSVTQQICFAISCMGKAAHLVCADHAHPCGDEGICLEHCHQLGILPFYVPHELLRMRVSANSWQVKRSFIHTLHT